jgi:hypothetical protein
MRACRLRQPSSHLPATSYIGFALRPFALDVGSGRRCTPRVVASARNEMDMSRPQSRRSRSASNERDFTSLTIAPLDADRVKRVLGSEAHGTTLRGFARRALGALASPGSHPDATGRRSHRRGTDRSSHADAELEPPEPARLPHLETAVAFCTNDARRARADRLHRSPLTPVGARRPTCSRSRPQTCRGQLRPMSRAALACCRPLQRGAAAASCKARGYCFASPRAKMLAT